MKPRIRFAFALVALCAAPGTAATIDVSDVEMTALASFSTQLSPTQTDSQVASGPLGGSAEVDLLLLAQGVRGEPFPNIATTQTRPFASSAASANGVFGVGVSGFFLQDALPPHHLVASGTMSQSVTNNGTSPVPLALDFEIPAPMVSFFGVGLTAPGVSAERDAIGTAIITLRTVLTRTDGTTSEAQIFEYGLRVLREPVSGVLFPFAAGDVGNTLTRVDQADGSFDFLLGDFIGDDVSIGTVGPGETLEFVYDYFTEARTGFGETAVRAAIGDPFDLSVGGASFGLVVVPEPGTLALLGTGLAGLAAMGRRRRSRP